MTWDTSSTVSSLFTRFAGPAAMTGGLLGSLAIFLHSLQPSGCVGSECGAQSMRTASGLATGIGSVAALLVLIGIVGLTLMARHSGRSPKLMHTGLLCAAVGFLVLLAAVFIQAAFFGGDFSGMPYFVVVGMVALIIGFVLIGIFILRSGLLPRRVGGPPCNEQRPAAGCERTNLGCPARYSIPTRDRLGRLFHVDG
ncbi:hypothetical protein GCM10027404_17560 [Arthrobacter tumbae]|uniref:hypothetical protein n=1 Tax=Arthrobacter tumbae TaxID=163874 RepID=UPI00195EC311|nr:hypothetical protein [Arthrobacter tumbae]MBM7780801.1 putative membrane protein [Arthrobacter tumbae]